MARVIVEGFRHEPGAHCGSTAFTDAVRHRGLKWSEPLVFGLASGLGFYLIEADRASPSRQFHGRSGLFELNFSKNTGLNFAEETQRDPELAVSRIKALLDAGEPVLAKSDIRYLPYYGTDTAFNGHKIVIAGRDDDTGEIFVADTHFKGLQTITDDDLKRALSSDGAPVFSSDCMYGPLRRCDNERPIAQAITQAIHCTADQMLNDPTGIGGLAGIDRFAEVVESYQERDDASWIAKFGYQVIEKRGSGGGMFRRLFARFLEEAIALAGVPATSAESMHAIADAWSELAAALKTASSDAGAWTGVGALATRVAQLERAFFEASLT